MIVLAIHEYKGICTYLLDPTLARWNIIIEKIKKQKLSSI